MTLSDRETLLLNALPTFKQRNRPSHPPELTRGPDLVKDAHILELMFRGSLLDGHSDTSSLTGFAAALPNPETQLSAADVHRETTYPNGAGVYVYEFGRQGGRDRFQDTKLRLLMGSFLMALYSLYRTGYLDNLTGPPQLAPSLSAIPCLLIPGCQSRFFRASVHVTSRVISTLRTEPRSFP